jgi:hypothetical protein
MILNIATREYLDCGRTAKTIGDINITYTNTTINTNSITTTNTTFY